MLSITEEDGARYRGAEDEQGVSASRSRDHTRVCIVAPSTRNLGGQAVQAKRLVEHLTEFPEIEISVVHVDSLLPRGLRWLQRIKYVRTVVNEIRYLMSLLVELRRVDVVHVFAASYLSFLLAPTPALVVSRLYGKKTILNYRSGQAEDHLRRWRRTAVPTARLADRRIVGSGFLVNVFAKFGLEAESIPNIVDADRYCYRRRDPLRPVFLGNRNFELHYDVATLLRAFHRIQNARSDAKLLLAGEGSQREALEELADDLELTEVTFLGRVAPEKMPTLYDEADIYLNASRVDNMPTSLIEAFAAGLPVVTTSAGGIPYLVRHEENGLLVAPGDDQALAAEALRLVRNPTLAKSLVETARTECEDRYSGTAVCDQWVGLYRELATDCGAPRTVNEVRVGSRKVGGNSDRVSRPASGSVERQTVSEP